MVERKTAVIERFTDSNAEAVAAARFFRNDAVDLDDLRMAAHNRLREAARGQRVLVVQDTTTINYAHHDGRLDEHDDDLGPIRKGVGTGFFLHPSLVIASTGLPLGIADVAVWNRRHDQPDKHARNYATQPIEEKESYRWIESSYRAQEALADAAHITIVADREGDIYEWFHRVPDDKTDLLVRSRSDRRLADTGAGADTGADTGADAGADTGADTGLLYERLGAAPLLGTTGFSLRSRPGRKAREVQCDVRLVAVALARPQQATGPASVPVFAVEVRETATSAGDHEPVRWRLLTTRVVEDLAGALALIEDYRQRWHVEQLFRGMKQQGLEVGASQLTRGSALKRLCVMAIEAAVTVMQLVCARDGAVEASARVTFTPEEIVFLGILSADLGGSTAKQQNPHRVGSLAWASWVIARLGGWKCYGAPPGPIRMHRGWVRFADRYAGWRLAGHSRLLDSEDRTNDV
jgi:hypothetical protein